MYYTNRKFLMQKVGNVCKYDIVHMYIYMYVCVCVCMYYVCKYDFLHCCKFTMLLKLMLPVLTLHNTKQYVHTVTPGLSENLIYPTLCCESPPPLCVLFTLIYRTPGLSDTFYEEQTWSDKPGPTVYWNQKVLLGKLRFDCTSFE